ncbi:hypothetical protein N3K66_004211 [Trichothecium roseum]|uniref:Uncharacterized protein n=1 Tax=Trichothecium roseum TaxID=47278 RepID=A0ACC0V0L3_9HYPO|nr:hypothetical protein N3K66_004211 [Trichothecium roseum]
MATTAKSVAKLAIEKSYQGRGLRVLVYPAPITFAERRSVLQVLERYGPIETFRLTHGFHSNFFSATKDTETATRLLEASPVSYMVSTTTSPGAASTAGADLTAPPSFESIKPTTTMYDPGALGPSGASGAPGASGESTSSSVKQHRKQAFTLEIYPIEEKYRHVPSSDKMASHADWPLSYKNNTSFMAAALKQVVPASLAATGLTSWDNDPTDKRGQMSIRDRRVRERNFSPRFMKYGLADDGGEEPYKNGQRRRYKAQ